MENIDPTNCDLDRVGIDVGGDISAIQRIISPSLQNAMKGTGGKKSEMHVRCYIPIKIHFTLVGVCVAGLRRGKKSKTRKSALNLHKRTNIDVGMISLGDAESYARLLTSTIYLSQDAASGIWDCLRNVKGGKEDKGGSDRDADVCFNIEASRHWQVFIV